MFAADPIISDEIKDVALAFALALAGDECVVRSLLSWLLMLSINIPNAANPYVFRGIEEEEWSWSYDENNDDDDDDDNDDDDDHDDDDGDDDDDDDDDYDHD